MEEKNSLFNAEEENKSKNNRNKLIIVLGAAILVAAIVLTVALVGVVVKTDEKKNDETMYVASTTEFAPETSEEVNLDELLNGDKSSEQASTAEESKTAVTFDANDTTKNEFVESYEHLSVNGDNLLSDHFENEFIQMVSKEYGVDPDLLVAIYSVPNSGTNFVLQFNGDKRGGNYVKSPATLEKVYHIDLNGKITVATGTNKGNVGVSYPESVMTVAMVKTVVMEQYPDYFTGLKND
jgi:flagellar basal body-associated protein FliL